MKVTDFTRSALAYRKEERDLKRQGYMECGAWTNERWRMGLPLVEAVKISADRQRVYVKPMIGAPADASMSRTLRKAR